MRPSSKAEARRHGYHKLLPTASASIRLAPRWSRTWRRISDRQNSWDDHRVGRQWLGTRQSRHHPDYIDLTIADVGEWLEDMTGDTE